MHRWALKILPVLAKAFRKRKRSVGRSWRMDETYIRVGGQWKYLYRAVDRLSQTVDFLRTARRDEAAARRFFERAIELHDVPENVTIDQGGANTAAVLGLIAHSGASIELRQYKYLNKMIVPSSAEHGPCSASRNPTMRADKSRTSRRCT